MRVVMVVESRWVSVCLYISVCVCVCVCVLIKIHTFSMDLLVFIGGEQGAKVGKKCVFMLLEERLEGGRRRRGRRGCACMCMCI